MRKKGTYSIDEQDNPKDTIVNEPAQALYGKTLSASSILMINNFDMSEPLERIHVFRNGLSKQSFNKLKEATGLDYNKLAAALAVSPKTLQRKDTFDVVQSEKMYHLADLYAIGIEYFGDEGFKRWMSRPLFSIGNIKPIDLIDVSEGVEILKKEILRVQHGIAI